MNRMSPRETLSSWLSASSSSSCSSDIGSNRWWLRRIWWCTRWRGAATSWLPDVVIRRMPTGCWESDMFLLRGLSVASEAVEVEDHHLFATQLEQAAFLPDVEHATDGVQGGAGHLGEVLPRQRKVDVHAVRAFAAGTLGEAQQGVGQALFDRLGGQFAEALVGFLQALADGLQDMLAKVRTGPAERLPLARRPAQRRGWLHRQGGGGVLAQVHGAGDAEQFAAVDVADHDALAGRGQLRDLQVAAEQVIEVLGGFALLEDVLALGVGAGTGVGQGIAQLAIAQRGEQRKLDQLGVGGHGGVRLGVRLVERMLLRSSSPGAIFLRLSPRSLSQDKKTPVRMRANGVSQP